MNFTIFFSFSKGTPPKVASEEEDEKEQKVFTKIPPSDQFSTMMNVSNDETKNVHEDLNLTFCQFCGLSFPEKTLNAHIRRVHEIVEEAEKIHNCDLCGKKFSCTTYLNRHIRKIHKQKPKQKGSKIVPKAEEKSKIETTSNDESSTNNENFNNLESITANFQCGICSKTFEESKDLQKHIRNIHEDKLDPTLVDCQYCERSFPENSLRHHISSVHKDCKDKIYQCEFCEN